MTDYYDTQDEQRSKVYVLDESKINTLEDVIHVLTHSGFNVILMDDITGHPLEKYLKRFGE